MILKRILIVSLSQPWATRLDTSLRAAQGFELVGHVTNLMDAYNAAEGDAPTTAIVAQEFVTLDEMKPIFQNKLPQFALYLTKDSDEAADLVSETMLRALKNLDKYNKWTNPKARLFTIAKNLFISKCRKKSKMSTVELIDNVHALQNVSPKAYTNLSSQNILEEINRLDDRNRVPFKMHYEWYKYQEIADNLDLSLWTVKNRIHFARKELKKVISRT